MTGRAEVGDVGRCSGESSVGAETGVERRGTYAGAIDIGMTDERKAGGSAGGGEETVGGTPSRCGELNDGSIDGGAEHEADRGPPVEVGGCWREVEESVHRTATADAATPGVDPQGSEWAATGREIPPEASWCAESGEEIGRGGRSARSRFDQQHADVGVAAEPFGDDTSGGPCTDDDHVPLVTVRIHSASVAPTASASAIEGVVGRR